MVCPGVNDADNLGIMFSLFLFLFKFTSSRGRDSALKSITSDDSGNLTRRSLWGNRSVVSSSEPRLTLVIFRGYVEWLCEVHCDHISSWTIRIKMFFFPTDLIFPIRCREKVSWCLTRMARASISQKTGSFYKYQVFLRWSLFFYWTFFFIIDVCYFLSSVVIDGNHNS